MKQAGFTQEQSYFLEGEVEIDMGFRISETYIWILALLHNNYIISPNYFQFLALFPHQKYSNGVSKDHCKNQKQCIYSKASIYFRFYLELLNLFLLLQFYIICNMSFLYHFSALFKVTVTTYLPKVHYLVLCLRDLSVVIIYHSHAEVLSSPSKAYDAVPSTPLTALLSAWLLLFLMHSALTLLKVATWTFFYLLLSLVI